MSSLFLKILSASPDGYLHETPGPQVANTAADTTGGYGNGIAVTYGGNAAIANTGTTTGYMNSINSQLAGLQSPVTANNNVVQAQTNAYDIQAQRGLQAQQDQNAQQAYGSGQSNAGGEALAQQQAGEQTATGEAQNTAQAIGTQQAAQTGELENLEGLGTNASLQQQSTLNQANQANAGLAEQYGALGQAQNQYLGQLGQQQKQFGVTSAQNQQQINNQLAEAQATNATNIYGEQGTIAGQLQ